MNDKDSLRLDCVIKESLQTNVKPSEILNDKLKTEMRRNFYMNQEKSQLCMVERTVSLWFYPLLMNSIFAVLGICLVRIFVPDQMIVALITALCGVWVLCGAVLTFVGVKYFELKQCATVVV